MILPRSETNAHDTWVEWNMSTSAHGLPALSRAKGAFKKMMWLVAIVTSAVALTYHMYVISAKYFQDDIKVKMTIHHNRKLTFPSVTICNMNPIKESAVRESGSFALQQMFNVKNKPGKKRKRRRKRQAAVADVTSSGCPGEGNIHAGSGLCFWEDTGRYDSWDTAFRRCQDVHKGSLPILNTESLWNFIDTHRGFSNVNCTDLCPTFWLGVKHERLYDLVPLTSDPFSMERWYPGYPDKCRIAWPFRWYIYSWLGYTDRCHNETTINDVRTVCQKLTHCPHAAYVSRDENDICYFLLDTKLNVTWSEARDLCPLYDPNATLAELDTLGKVTHVMDAGVLDQVNGTYWINLRDGVWQTSGRNVSYTNLEEGEDPGGMSGCWAADTDLGHAWISRHCYHDALILCQWINTTSSYVRGTESTAAEPDLTTLRIATTTTPVPTPTTTPTTTRQVSTTSTQRSRTTTRTTTTRNLPSSSIVTTQTTTSRLGVSTLKISSTPRNAPPKSSMAPPTTTPSPDAPPPVPPTVPGSQYPERIALRKAFQAEEELLGMLAELGEEQRAALGYKRRDILNDCYFAGRQCDWSRQFTRIYNGIHGNCYIFNSGWNESVAVEVAEHNGRRYGLSLVLNVVQDEYTERFGEEAGVRVVVHSQNSMPFPEDEGISVQPGQLNSIALKKLTMDRKSRDGSECIHHDDEQNLTRNVYQELYPVKYSRKACLKTCYQKYVIEECECSDPSYPREGQAFPSPTVSVCDISNITQDDCMYGVRKRFLQNKLVCSCPEACSDEFYYTIVSSASWPSKNYLEKYWPHFLRLAPDLFKNVSDYRKFRKNMLKLEIYYEDLANERVEEIPTYEDFRYISDVGGAMGLWFGFSLLTILEMAVLVLQLLKSSWAQRRKVSTTPPESYTERNLKQYGVKRRVSLDPPMPGDDGGAPIAHLPLGTSPGPLPPTDPLSPYSGAGNSGDTGGGEEGMGSLEDVMANNLATRIHIGRDTPGGRGGVREGSAGVSSVSSMFTVHTFLSPDATDHNDSPLLPSVH